MTSSSLVDSLLRARRALEREPSPPVRRMLLLLAALVFVGGSIVAANRIQLDLATVRWGYLVVAGLVGVPLTAAVNALEYHVSATIVGLRPGPWQAMRVSILGTAANLLPLPGATLVRLRGLRQLGSGYGDATMATLAIGVGWIGVAAGVVGGWLLVAGQAASSGPFLAGATAALLLVPQLLRRAVPRSRRRWWHLRRIVTVEVLLVLVGIARQWLVLMALGADAALGGAVVLVLSAALAAAAGVFPGGLGLREGISALLGPLVGLPPSFGFMGAAVNRVLGILLHAPMAIWLSLGDRGQGIATAQSKEPADSHPGDVGS